MLVMPYGATLAQPNLTAKIAGWNKKNGSKMQMLRRARGHPYGWGQSVPTLAYAISILVAISILEICEKNLHFRKNVNLTKLIEWRWHLVAR